MDANAKNGRADLSQKIVEFWHTKCHAVTNYFLKHNIGLGSAVVMTMYKLGFPEARADWIAKNGVQTHAFPKEGEYIAKKAK